jgi:hypothetical protein
VDSRVTLFTNRTNNIDLNFLSSEMLLPSNGFITSPLHIKVQDNATESVYTIPIYANITFPDKKYDSKQKVNNSSFPEDITLSPNIGGIGRENGERGTEEPQIKKPHRNSNLTANTTFSRSLSCMN